KGPSGGPRAPPSCASRRHGRRRNENHSRKLQLSAGSVILGAGKFQVRRGSFPFSDRLGGRTLVMMQENGSRHFAPGRCRDSLHLPARLNLPRRLRSVLSASDVAHVTILKAHKKREQFRGQTEAEYRGWLRRILANLIADAARVSEPELLRTLEQSSAWLQDRLVLDDPPPSHPAPPPQHLPPPA